MSLWYSTECGDRRKSKKRNRPNICTVDERGAGTEKRYVFLNRGRGDT
jgi:hypothetical protein